MEFVKLKLGQNLNNKPQAVFVAITTEAKIWKGYDGISKEEEEMFVPLVLMIDRWDGCKGFFGGEVESDESLLDAAWREFSEESGSELSNKEKANSNIVSSIETENLVTHLIEIKVSLERMKEFLYGVNKAQHFLSEVSGVSAVQFINYKNKNSFDNYMKNNFALTVKEEIFDLIVFNGWDVKYGLNIDFNFKSWNKKREEKNSSLKQKKKN